MFDGPSLMVDDRHSALFAALKRHFSRFSEISAIHLYTDFGAANLSDIFLNNPYCVLIMLVGGEEVVF